jgi:hypothetical protein
VGETDYSTAHPGSDPNYLGDVSIHRLWNGWSWEVQISWAGGGGRLQHGTYRIGPRLFGGGLFRGQCYRQMRVWACGRRADSSTRFSGASSFK